MQESQRIKTTTKASSLVVVFIGLIFLIGGIIYNITSSYKDDWPVVTSTVTELDTFNDKAYVKFYYDLDKDGVEEELYGRLNGYSDFWEEGKQMEIRFDPNMTLNKNYGCYEVEQANKISILAPVLFGGGITLLGIIIFITTKNKDYTRKVTEKLDINQSKIVEEQAKSNTSLDTDYIFDIDRELKRGFSIKDEYGRKIYTLEKIKSGFFSAPLYKLTNYITGYKYQLKIGMVTSSSAGYYNANDELFTSFKINDMKCWDYLAKKCISVKELKTTTANPTIQIYKADELIGIVNTSNPTNPNSIQSFKLSTLGMNTRYTIKTNSDNLDDVFICVFTISRAYRLSNLIYMR